MIAYSQDARIDIDDVRDATDLALAFKDFVDLLLIPGDHETRAALAEDIGHLFGHAVLIDRHRDGADHLAGVHRPIQHWAVAANDGDMDSLEQNFPTPLIARPVFRPCFRAS